MTYKYNQFLHSLLTPLFLILTWNHPTVAQEQWHDSPGIQLTNNKIINANELQIINRSNDRYFMIDNDSNQLFIFSDVMFYKDSIFNYYVYRSVHSGFKQIYGIFGSENPILKLTYTYFVSGQDQFGHAYSGYQRIHFFMKENGPIYRSRLKYISAAVNDKKSSFRHVKKARLFYWLSAVWGGIWIPSMVLAIPNLPVAATASVFFGIGISTAAFYSLGKGQQSKALSSY